MLILPALQILLIFDIGLGFLHCLYSGVVPRIICGSKWRAGWQLRAGDILTRPSFSNTLLWPRYIRYQYFQYSSLAQRYIRYQYFQYSSLAQRYIRYPLPPSRYIRYQ